MFGILSDSLGVRICSRKFVVWFFWFCLNGNLHKACHKRCSAFCSSSFPLSTVLFVSLSSLRGPARAGVLPLCCSSCPCREASLTTGSPTLSFFSFCGPLSASLCSPFPPPPSRPFFPSFPLSLRLLLLLSQSVFSCLSVFLSSVFSSLSLSLSQSLFVFVSFCFFSLSLSLFFLLSSFCVFLSGWRSSSFFVVSQFALSSLFFVFISLPLALPPLRLLHGDPRTSKCECKFCP